MGEIEKPEGFTGNDRYVVRRCLGGGSLGLVYEAYDRKRKAVVALKTLRMFGSSGLYRLKQEFRSLSDISHPNLVSLYELVGEDDNWFIAMEMVKGVNFYQFVRGEDSPNPLSSATWMSNEIGSLASDPTAHIPLDQPDPTHVEDVDRLRRSFVQLLSGVAALHATGKLHRDIKPSNVLVTSEGRVVLLDFGLIYDTDRAASELSRIDKVMGTVAFIAPEHAMGGAPSPSTDMYSVGVLLFQGLTGRLPFDGSMMDMLQAMQDSEPPKPSDMIPDLPKELNDLCAALMAKDPLRRPTAVEALLRLGEDPSMLAVKVRARGRSQDRIEGREAERQILDSAYTTARNGRAVVCVVRGETGMGKTSLVQHFLSELRNREEVTILRGRCYERESVPFKAFDSMMDGLRRRLKRLPEEEVLQILPPDAWLVTRLFPVLKELVQDTEPTDAGVIADPLEQRLRAFEVCRKMIRNLAKRRPVVVFLDDVQWGDSDSARMLAGWLHGLQRVRMLVIISYRSEDKATSPFLAQLLHDPVFARSEVRELDLAPLKPGLATAVARGLIGDTFPNPTEAAVWIADESGGNPHLMAELATALKASAEMGVDNQLADLSLDELVRARVKQLSEPAQRLLRFVSVAGRPLPARVLSSAAELAEGGVHELNLLRSGRFVKTTQSPLGELVELYHSRVGGAVRDAWTPEELARHHLTMARAMERERWDDPEALMMHYLSGGEQDRAGELAMGAARQASETLAFERAANLYTTALELGHWDLATEEDLRSRLADTLVYAGRGEKAARVYLELAAGADEATSIELRRKAAEQLITNGYIDEGRVLLIEVLRRVQLKLPGSNRSAVVAHYMHRACLRWNGMIFVDTEEADISPADLQRIDACWLTALSMSFVDPVLGMYFHDRNLLYSLRSGEQYRVLRAFTMELAFMVQRGNYDWNAWSKLLVRCKALANRVNIAHGTALVFMAEGMSAYFEGRFKNAYRHLRQAERTIVELCPGVTFELSQSRLFALRSLMYVGELKQVALEHPKLASEASECGNLLLSSSLRSDIFVLLPLAQDAPDKARSHLASAKAQWSRSGAHFQHLFEIRGQVYLALYEGRGEDAWQEIDRVWETFRGALLDKGITSRVAMHDARATAALGRGKAGIRDAAASAKALLATKSQRMAEPCGHMIIGGIALLNGDKKAAGESYERAMEGFVKVEMHMHAAVARHRLGSVKDGREGTLLTQAAEGWFTNQDVVDIDKLCQAIAPIPR